MKRNKIPILILIVILISTVSLSCFPQMVWDAIPSVDNMYDVGSPTLRWQDEYLAGNLYTDGNINSDNSDLDIVTGTGHTLVLDNPVYNDMALSMSNVRTPAANAPTFRSYLQSEVPAFSPTQVNVLYFSAQLPHSYKEGTDLEFHIHLVYPDANAGNSVWYFTYSWSNYGDNFPVASSTTATIASPTVANRHQKADIISAISGTGKKISSVLLCSIQRLGNVLEDTYGSEIYLISGDFHYQSDTVGSRTEMAK